MHDEIIRYSLDGEISDTNLEVHKQSLIHFLEGQMREDGVVPSLDLDPGFTLEYDHAGEVFKFALSVYGIYVGKGTEVWDTAGMTSGKIVKTYTRPIK